MTDLKNYYLFVATAPNLPSSNYWMYLLKWDKHI